MPGLTIRRPEDFIALAPVMLGFQPEHSLVMMTLTSFHARVDLPSNPQEVEEVVEMMIDPCLRHSVERVAFVIYDDGDNELLKTALAVTFLAAGVEVLVAYDYADGKCREFGTDEWTEYDLAASPVTLDAYMMGRCPQGTRQQMVDSLKPQGTGWTTEQSDAIDEMIKLGADKYGGTKLSRINAPGMVELWTGCLVGSDPGSAISKDAAVVLGIAAWLGGDGAKAWGALDYADMSKPYAVMLESLLTNAINPREWPE